MKKIEKPKRVQQSDEELRVDVYNDAEMVALGLRVPPLVPRDPSVWTKTPSEKFILKRERARDKTEFLTRWAGKKKSIPFYDKLIVRYTRFRRVERPLYPLNVDKVIFQKSWQSTKTTL